MLRFGPFCLDLGHIAWILAVWQNGRMYGRTDSPCVLKDFIPFGAAAQKGKKIISGKLIIAPTSAWRHWIEKQQQRQQQ